MKGRRNSAEHAQTVGELDSLVEPTVQELNRHKLMGDQLNPGKKRILRLLSKMESIKIFVACWHRERREKKLVIA